MSDSAVSLHLEKISIHWCMLLRIGFPEKYRNLYLLNLILISFYFILFFALKININKTLMFSTFDSSTYLSVANWIQGSSAANYTMIRPFLYPLVLVICYNGFGPFGLWLFQFLCWIFSINFLFLAIRRITGNSALSFIGAGLFALNCSFFMLTFHALPEVLTTFLLSFLVFIISCNFHNFRTLAFFQRTLLILVLLAIVKPVFYFVLVFLLLVIFPIYYLKENLRRPKKFLISLLILIPLFIQIGIMKYRFNTFGVSEIGGNTFRDYFFAQGLQNINNITYEDAVHQAQTHSGNEQISYILAHKKSYLKSYLGNLYDNIDAEPVLLESPVLYKPLYRFTTNLNTIYLVLHLLFLIPLIFVIVNSARKRKYRDVVLFLWMAALLYYILLTSGISFWQGDRLVLPSLPLWITLYILITNYLSFRQNGNTSGSGNIG
jgi:hypothetical protein